MNILLITCDQYRADALSAAGHPVLRTPALDQLAAEGVRFSNHFGQAAPCSPGRASLYTGMYMMNHRVVSNASPLENRHTNFALELRKVLPS
jgi:arylsulfatase A-like enzyme